MKTVGVLILLMQSFAIATVQPSTEFVSGKVEFEIRNMGFNVTGSMGGVVIDLKQPSADAATWSIEGTADPATIETGIALRDKHLKKSDYFDVEKYPRINLRSVSIKQKAKDKYEGTFVLTIKNISKNIVIPFSIKNTGESMVMGGTFIINRLDYALGEESTILSDNVKIKVSGLFNNK